VYNCRNPKVNILFIIWCDDLKQKSCKYKVMMVYPYDPQNIMPGGGIRYVDLLLNNLIERKVDVSLIGVNLEGGQNQDLKIPFAPILNKSDNCWRFLINLFFKVPFMKIENGTIIHSHRSYFLLPFILFKPHNPKIVTLHGITLEIIKTSSYNRYYNHIKKVYRIAEKFLLRRIDFHVAVSDNVKDFFENMYPFLNGKIIVISSGIDTQLFRKLEKSNLRKKYGFDDSENIVLFVGRLEKIKNIAFLIKSFKILTEIIENSRLLIVGDGIEKQDLKNLSEQLSLKNVTFMGSQKMENMPEIYNLADLLALCSHSEASPTVVKEAIACGIPVVCTNVGDVESIITHESLGRILYNNNISDFSIAMSEVLKKKPIALDKFREIKMKFDFSSIAESYENLYGSICENK
jgi:glycosyltransferase involved in cell wall biosynthesis